MLDLNVFSKQNKLAIRSLSSLRMSLVGEYGFTMYREPIEIEFSLFEFIQSTSSTRITF